MIKTYKECFCRCSFFDWKNRDVTLGGYYASPDFRKYKTYMYAIVDNTAYVKREDEIEVEINYDTFINHFFIE